MIDQAPVYAEPDEDPYLNNIVSGFTMSMVPQTEDLLFPDDKERTLSIWDDVDWWTGESKTAPVVTDQMSSTTKEREQAEETFAASTPGSSAAFQAAEAATMGTKGEQRWFQMANGRIPENRLESVPGLGTYRSDAAQAMRLMKRAAKKDGINLGGGGYRSYAEQKALLYKREQGIMVADPGTSEHGWGMASDIDVNDPKVFKWLNHNAKRFGWVNPEWAQNGVEPWHWEFQPSDDMDFKLPIRRRVRTKTKVEAPPARTLGGSDLTDPVPIGSDKGGFMDAVMSLVDEDVEVETVKGKRRFNLSGANPKPKNRDEIVAYARKVAERYGWTGKQWLALYELGQRESGWNPKADNPDSTANGIPQRLMSAHPFSEGEKRKWADPRYQIRWFARYVADRYGAPSDALAFHDAEGHY